MSVVKCVERPKEALALQFNGGNAKEIMEFGGAYWLILSQEGGDVYYCPEDSGSVKMHLGDWLVKHELHFGLDWYSDAVFRSLFDIL